MMTGASQKPAKGTAKLERRKRRLTAKAFEDGEKQKVRRRDKGCRFPFCQCKRFGLGQHVSHLRHAGMGGSPSGDRSVAANMIQLCVWRHQGGRVAVHRGTLRVVPLTAEGTYGPVAWEIDGEALQPFGEPPLVNTVFLPHGWVRVAEEIRPGTLKPPEDWQLRLLRELSDLKF